MYEQEMKRRKVHIRITDVLGVNRANEWSRME